MKKVRAGFSVLVFAFLCFSCAFSPSVYKDSDGLVEQGDFNSALSALIEKEKTYGKKNQVLFYLDTGLLSHFSGEYEDSTERLSLAESKILENNAISISESVMSAVVNDNSATYGGEDFEDIYINIFKALNFYHLGNLESGMVEVRKIDNKIRLLTTKYEGIIQETKKEFDELDSSIKDSIGQGGQKLFSYNFSNSALARYISMLYYRHLGQMDDVRIDLQAVDKAFSSQPHLYPFPAPHKIKDELNVKPSDGRLNIISFAGRFPVKVESVVSFFIDTVYVKFAFPELKARPSVVSSVEVEVENVGTFTLEKIEDMSLIAGETFNQKRDIIYSRSLLRGISKGVATAASTVAVSQSGAQNGDTAGLAMLVNIIGNIYSDVSEQADLRLSRYFPGVAYVGGITLSPGIYNVRVNYKNKNGYVIYSEYFKDVDVKSGDLNLRESVCLR